MDKKILDQQSQYWEKNFLSKPEMFGLEPSKAAINTLKNFKEEKIKKIVELGAGLGRDTIFFAKNSINVEALDYSPTAIKIINKKVLEHKLSNVVSTKMFDVRKKIAREVLSNIKDYFGDYLYQTVVRTNVKLEEAVGLGVPITIYDRQSSGFQDYKSLAREVSKKRIVRS